MCENFQELMNNLTPRERQICDVLLNEPGITKRGIGQQVGVSRHAVRWHLENVYDKLHINSKPELVKILCEGKSQR